MQFCASTAVPTVDGGCKLGRAGADDEFELDEISGCGGCGSAEIRAAERLVRIRRYAFAPRQIHACVVVLPVSK
jgi:hypothetical protein